MVNAWNVADLPVTDYRTDDELYQDYLKNFWVENESCDYLL
jgi:ribonucleotide reductase beta subunit family protein with ferritin-like domain